MNDIYPVVGKYVKIILPHVNVEHDWLILTFSLKVWFKSRHLQLNCRWKCIGKIGIIIIQKIPVKIGWQNLGNISIWIISS